MNHRRSGSLLLLLLGTGALLAACSGKSGDASGGMGGSGQAASGGKGGSGGSGIVAGQAGVGDEACALPLEAGPCKAALSRFGFNPETQRCEPFVFGGCEGNDNNFETFESCVAACG